jgi:CRP-like cAMP-binding protein
VTLDISQTFLTAQDAAVESPLPGRNYAKPRPARNVMHFPARQSFANGILAELPKALLDKISPHLRLVDLRRDEYLYQPEDRIDYIYFPETAVFSEYQMLDDGRTIEIAMMGKESVIGVASMFGPCTAVNWAQVCAAGTAMKIESELFRRVAGTESAVKAMLNDQINSYIRSISHKVICNTHHSVEERLCSWLLMFSDRCVAGPLKLTQEQIARVLGVYRPSITCIAGDLKHRGLIDYVRGKINIRDRDGLIRSACACYREFSVVANRQNFCGKVARM